MPAIEAYAAMQPMQCHFEAYCAMQLRHMLLQPTQRHMLLCNLSNASRLGANQALNLALFEHVTLQEELRTLRTCRNLIGLVVGKTESQEV